MADRLEDLLRACTVRVTGGPMPGAGFFVAPGMVLTCVHVIGDGDAGGLTVQWECDGQPPAEVPVTGRVVVLADKGRPIPALDRDYPDIAVIEVGGLQGHPCVRIDHEWPSAEDGFQVFGYPREGGAVRLTPARLTYRGTHGTAPVAYLDLASDTVKRGMSGAAVLNLRTGSVCAAVVASKDLASPAGALAVPWSAIDEDLAEVLAANRAFHRSDRRWEDAAASVTVVPPLAAQSALLTPICNLPHRNPDFAGRGRSLAALRRGVARGPVAVVTVHGLGGIGKTQLALEFAHRGFAKGQYRIAWWVRAEFALSMAEDLAALAPGLGVPVIADQEENIAAVRAALARRDDWLLVFDNAPDAAAVRAWLPSGPGHTVITSRDSGWGGLAKRVDIREFTRPESMEYLQRRSPRQEPTEADALADVLGDLPLALAQAAAYLELHGGLSIAAYMQLYQNQQSAGQLLAAGMDGYPHSVATTWLIHFQELAAGEPAALQLLRLCAHLDPDDINLSLLLSRPDLLAGPLTGDLAQAARDAGRREDAIGALARTGLITRLDGGSRIRIHRLVAQVTRHQLAAVTPHRRWRLGRHRGSEVQWSNHALETVYQLFPEYPWLPECWPVAADLVAHVSATVDIAARYGSATGTAGWLLNKLGAYLNSRGDDTASQVTQQRAVAVFEAAYGPDDFYVARALSDLATTQKETDPAAAVASGERALAIFQALSGPDHPLVAGALGNLGTFQRRAGDLNAARASQERALTIFQALYGPDHPDVAIALGNLGNLERDLGDLDSAGANLQRALDILEAGAGPDHPQVAIIMGHIGMLQRQLGDLNAARTSQERALEIMQSVLGPDHREVAIILGHLGTVQQELGELDAARTSMQRGLDIMRSTHGPNHPATLSAKSLLDELTD
jgi:tetratricopeptide (TPR) repeat protein